MIDATVSNDAPPEKQIEQILAIAPIIPGQQQQQSSTHAGFAESKALPTEQNKSLPSQPTQPQATANELIDFGQNNGASPAQAPSQQTSMPAGLQQPLQPSTNDATARQVTRQDSLGNEEQFVDAES